MLTDSIHELQANGFADVAYPSDLRSAVLSAAKSWQLFCNLPKDVKQSFRYLEDGKYDEGGFEIKEDPGLRKDLKENFHVMLKDRARLNATAEKIGTPEPIKFIRDADMLIELAAPLIGDFAKSLEEVFSLNGLYDEVMERSDRWVLRYLHYFGERESGAPTAISHTDKGGFTLHLFESHPGIEYLDWGKKWNSMVVRDGETAIISGMQLQLKSGSALKALCHRVVANPETAHEGRYSIVCFVPFLKTPAYNKRGKGRLQEFEEGFNYNMPHDDFAALFE